jgi:Na+/melibiose symporter-like transporter
MGISAAVFVFYFTLVLHVTPVRFTSLMALMFSVNFLSSPVWAGIGNRLGKHWALALGAFVTASYMVLAFVMPPDNLPLLILAFFLAGLGGGASDIMPRAMMADVCDEDRLNTGADRSGAVFALLVITIKVGQALSIGIVYVVLDLIGFDTKAGIDNTPSCLFGIAMLYCLVAGFCHLASGLLALRYPLTAARHDQIVGELAGGSPMAGFQSENPPSTISV